VSSRQGRSGPGGKSVADKEGARKSPMETVVCCAPDVCKTPMGSATPPIPYPITAMMCQAVSTCTTVNFTGMPAFTMASKIPAVVGDEAGSATGIKSGTVKGTAEPKQSSSTVWAEGNLVCRHLDTFGMNCDNTTGKLQCTEVGDGGGAGSGGDDGGPQDQAASNAPAAPETPAEQSWFDSVVDRAKDAGEWTKGAWNAASPYVHGVLDVAGLVPVFGEAADGASAVIYVLEGDKVSAGLSVAAMWPVGGQAATAGKVLYRGGKEVLSEGAEQVGKHADDVLKHGDEALGGTTKAADDAMEAAPGGSGGGSGKPPDSGGGGGGSGNGGGGKKKKKPEEPEKKSPRTSGSTRGAIRVCELGRRCPKGKAPFGSPRSPTVKISRPTDRTASKGSIISGIIPMGTSRCTIVEEYIWGAWSLHLELCINLP